MEQRFSPEAPCLPLTTETHHEQPRLPRTEELLDDDDYGHIDRAQSRALGHDVVTL